MERIVLAGQRHKVRRCNADTGCSRNAFQRHSDRLANCRNIVWLGPFWARSAFFLQPIISGPPPST